MTAGPRPRWSCSATPAHAHLADPGRTYSGLDRIIDTIRQPLVVLDEKRHITFANRAFYRAFAATPKEAIGRHLAVIGDRRLDVSALHDFLDLTRAQAEVVEDYQIEIELPALGSRILLLNAQPIRGGSLGKRETLVTIDDVTERKRAEMALKSAKRDAERASLSKSRFLACAGHDLRQPLQALSLVREILVKRIKDKQDEEALTLVARLDETAGALSGMLDTLLEINRLEAGIVHPEKVNFPINEVLRAGLPPRAEAKGQTPQPTVSVVDDEASVREAMGGLLQEEGWPVELYSSGEAFLGTYRPGREGCLVIDARMPRMGGLELLERLKAQGAGPPAIMIAGHADIRSAVRAMKAGATAVLEKPVQYDELVVKLERAPEPRRNSAAFLSLREAGPRRVAGLTRRQRQVVEMVVEGNPNKQIAYVLGISQRTVETHRAAAMKKLGARTLSELIHLTIAGSPHGK
ncbi:MAG: response regulator [Bradyrhizobium sp.]